MFSSAGLFRVRVAPFLALTVSFDFRKQEADGFASKLARLGCAQPILPQPLKEGLPTIQTLGYETKAQALI